MSSKMVKSFFSLMMIFAAYPSLLQGAASFQVDINQNDTYLLKGFPKKKLLALSRSNRLIPELEQKWRNQGEDDKQIVKIPPKGRKLAPPYLYNFAGIPETSFFCLKHFQAEHFSYITPFRLSREQFDKLINPSLLITSLGTNWEIFLNGHLLQKKMDYNKKANRLETLYYMRDIVIPFDQDLLKLDGDNHLVIHVIGDPLSSFTGFAMANEQVIANYQVLAKKVDPTLDLVFIFAYLVVGLYHILLFVRRPKEKYNLDFGLFAIGLFAYLMTRSNVLHNALPEHTLALYLLEVVDLYLMISFFVYFIDRYLIGKLSLVAKIYTGWAVFLSSTVAVLVYATGSLRLADDILRIWHFSMIPIMIYILYVPISKFADQFKGFRRQIYREEKKLSTFRAFFFTLGGTGAGNLIIGVLVLVVSAVYDILDAAIMNTGITLTRYGFFFFVMGIAVTLANRFLNVYKQVEDLNVNLESKVAARTQDLNKSLEQISDLKVQQDGDYFLTSLLLDPLNANQARNRSIVVDYYVEEKKKFNFRRWQKEIGGDLCYAHSIELRNKPYTLFLNADAMGKSIQGAGGILVLGSVLKSVTERAVLSSIERNLFPERWLRNVFVDMQKLFESFDGSMLISCVFGLVDEDNGFVYMLNAEHPWTVLYRNKQAQFIENEMTFHKLGTQGVDKKIWIRTFQMEPQDILIMGSDGRDDLLLGYDDEGQRIINEDENFFLKNVEESAGQLDPLVAALKQTGELTDDLSLLSLRADLEARPIDTREEQILAQAKEAFAAQEYQRVIDLIRNNLVEPSYPECWKLLIRSLIQLKRYRESYANSARFVELYPGESAYIYNTALSALQIGRHRDAIDWAERLRLRQPQNVKNLVLLAKAYLQQKNFGRAEKMAREALEVEADTPSAQKVLDRIPTIKAD